MYIKFKAQELYLRSERCYEVSYLKHKHKLLILSRFMTCNARFNTQTLVVHVSALEHCGKILITFEVSRFIGHNVSL